MIFEQFPSVKKVLLRLKEDESSGTVTYQGVELVRYKQGLTSLKSISSEYIETVLACLHNRLKHIGDSGELLGLALKILARTWVGEG